MVFVYFNRGGGNHAEEGYREGPSTGGGAVHRLASSASAAVTHRTHFNPNRISRSPFGTFTSERAMQLVFARTSVAFTATEQCGPGIWETPY